MARREARFRWLSSSWKERGKKLILKHFSKFIAHEQAQILGRTHDMGKTGRLLGHRFHPWGF